MGDKVKTGVIDVGGGLRGVYACGIFDYCLDNNITFDYAIGISAGSANVASFLANQRGRNFKFYYDYFFRKKCMSIWNFLFKKSYIDLNYIYGTLSNTDGEYPLDFKTLKESPTEWYIPATVAETGEAHNFDRNDLMLNHYEIFMASSAIPYVCKPHIIGGVTYYDGALGDPIPIQKAFDDGCDRVVVILTKPEAVPRESGSDLTVAKKIQKKYPKMAERLRKHADNYNREVKLSQEYVKQGKAIIVSPKDTCGVDTVKRSKTSLKALYDLGYEDAVKIKEFMNK